MGVFVIAVTVTTTAGVVYNLYPSKVRLYLENEAWVCTLELPNSEAKELESAHMWKSSWVVTDWDDTFLFKGRLEEPIGAYSPNPVSRTCNVVLRNYLSELMDYPVNKSYEYYYGNIKSVASQTMTIDDADDAFVEDELIGKVLFLEDITTLDDYATIYAESGTSGTFAPGWDITGTTSGAFANTQDDDDSDLGWRIVYDGKNYRIDEFSTTGVTDDNQSVFVYQDYVFPVAPGDVSGRADSEKFYLQGRFKSRDPEGDYTQLAPMRIYVKKGDSAEYEKMYISNISNDYRTVNAESDEVLGTYVASDDKIRVRVESGFSCMLLLGTWTSGGTWYPGGPETFHLDWYLDLETEYIRAYIPYKTRNVSTQQYVITDNAERTITVTVDSTNGFYDPDAEEWVLGGTWDDPDDDPDAGEYYHGWSTGDRWTVGDKNSTIVAELMSKYVDVKTNIEDTGYGSARVFKAETPLEVFDEFAMLDDTRLFSEMDKDSGMELFNYATDWGTAVDLSDYILAISRYDRKPGEYGGCIIFGALVQKPGTDDEFEDIVSDTQYADSYTSPKIIGIINSSIRSKPDANTAAKNMANRFSELVYAIEMPLADTTTTRHLQPGVYGSFPGSYINSTGTESHVISRVIVEIDYTADSRGEAMVMVSLGLGHSSPRDHLANKVRNIEKAIRKIRSQSLIERSSSGGLSAHNLDGDYHNGIDGTEDNFMGIDANGLPKDSGSKASDFAVAAKGVTNGDSHDHNGGDGAQIDHTTCSNIGTNTHAQIDSTLSTNTSNISTNTSNLSTHVADTANPHSVTAAQAGASPTYTDAGDASAWDYDSSAASLTIDGSWHTLDISSKIGSAAAKLVHLRMFISDNAVGYEFFINTGGNSNEHNSAVVKCLVANQNNHADAFVYTNSSGEIRYKATSGTDRIALLIRGYF